MTCSNLGCKVSLLDWHLRFLSTQIYSDKIEALGICKLCLKEGELRLSHVFPEFMYKLLYDENRKFIVTDKERKEISEYQKGLREHMLCGNCENKFSKYEDHAARVFRRSSFHPRERPETGQVCIENVSYKKFKLFLLSLLWRCGVSDLHLFSAVRLGPHEERLRCMLMLEDPGPSHYYPTRFRIYSKQNHELHRIISPPAPFHVKGIRGYRATFLGFRCTFFVNKPGHITPKQVRGACVGEDGVLPIGLIEDEGAQAYMQKIREHVTTMNSIIGLDE